MKKLHGLVEVSEKVVVAAWMALDQDDDSSFGRLLKVSDEYKAANMTPVFILDKDNMTIYCAARETLGKKLH
jgi:hypothetical protein